MNIKSSKFLRITSAAAAVTLAGVMTAPSQADAVSGGFTYTRAEVNRINKAINIQNGGCAVLSAASIAAGPAVGVAAFVECMAGSKEYKDAIADAARHGCELHAGWQETNQSESYDYVEYTYNPLHCTK